MVVQVTEEQLNRLLATLTTRQTSPTRCTARFDGTSNRTKVEEFISTISIYKEIENISNENGIKGLPLLLEGEAATWWQGVKAEVTTWTQAMDLLRAAYAPKKPVYAIYAEIFASKQEEHCPTDIFIAQKRALLAELPRKHTEEVQIDMLYSLFKIRTREKILRCSIESFDELINKARALEALEEESRDQQEFPSKPAPPASRKISRYSICRKTGHSHEECRRRKSAEHAKPEPPIFRCYGCGKPGVIRSRCPDCNQMRVSRIQTADFCSVSLAQARNRLTTQIGINGFKGHAFFDTGAKISVASTTLYNLLAANGTKFQKRKLLIALADGHPRIRTVLCADLTVELKNRRFTSPFIVLPEAERNRTLLGIDFLEIAEIVINAPQRSWNYVDKPKEHHFLEEEPAVTEPQASSKKARTRDVALVDTQRATPQTAPKKLDEKIWSEVRDVPQLLSPIPPSPTKSQEIGDDRRTIRTMLP
ncbi:Activity-regulated cytoskeleton associated protein 1 [Anthophora quadrimaculata]